MSEECDNKENKNGFSNVEFNIAMAELCNYPWLTVGDGIKVTIPPLRGFSEWNPYNDLNQLMPLAFEQEVDTKSTASGTWLVESLTDSHFISTNGKDPIQAIRECLWLIASMRSE